MREERTRSSEESQEGHSRQPRVTGETVARGLFERMQLEPLKERHDARLVQTLFTFVNGTLSIGLIALVAHFARSPFIFPSLGPTAYLMFHRPLAAASSPRNTLIGHFIGAVCGWLSLAAFGLLEAPSAIEAGVTWARVGATALSLGCTGGLMAWFRVSHPPAGATTLIVSLGLMPHLWQIPTLMLAVALLTLQALLINRLAGLEYPLWASPSADRKDG